jgi:hypothetical protein
MMPHAAKLGHMTARGDDYYYAGRPVPDAALAMLRRDYLAFRFSREPFGWKGSRWVAERHDHTAAGLRVVVTDDLAELRKALD